MARRRALFAVLVACAGLGSLALMAWALSSGGWSVADMVALAAFMVVVPWLAVGFVNGLIGLMLEWFSRDKLRAVNPMMTELDDSALDEPVRTSTAILLCIRNESTPRLVRNLQVLARGLLARADARQFHFYVLSDTTDAHRALEEEQAFGALARQWQPELALTYRRREHNTGYKAGNIQDFCAEFGARHELALVLDADSVMSANALRRLALTMQANPNIGILQGLVVGLPAASAFTRLFQFGMRLGMRSFTLGSAWWQGDCGPFWGHNAMIRIAPFAQHCQLPELKGRAGQTQAILSHDQIEAVLMRRAGYEVRVYPLEDESFEENPPNVIEFVARDLRWCAGNLQYTKLLTLPGLKATSRVQLVLAILMFAGAPAWLTLLGAMGWSVHQSSLAQAFHLPALAWAFGCVATMVALPRLASALVVLFRGSQRRRFGGGFRFVVSFMLEQIFSMLLVPAMWVSQTLLMMGLPFGRRMVWGSQNRDAAHVSWGQAARAFGLHTLLGLALGWLWIDVQAPQTWWVSYFLAGLWLSVPLAVVTARPWLGRVMVRAQLAAVPEEFTQTAFLVDRRRLAELTDTAVVNATAPSTPSFEPGR